MEQKNFRANSGVLLLNKFELPHPEEDNCCSWKVTIVVVGRHLPTTTIILPLNAVNSKWPNNSYQAFPRKFYYFIQKIKFLLGLV